MPDDAMDLNDEGVEARLVSPHGFDGHGLTPDAVTEAAKRIARLRVEFLTGRLTPSQVDELFAASAIGAEWTRELYEARDELAAALRAVPESDERVRLDSETIDRAQELVTYLTCPWFNKTGNKTCESGCWDEPACETNGPHLDTIVEVLSTVAALSPDEAAGGE